MNSWLSAGLMVLASGGIATAGVVAAKPQRWHIIAGLPLRLYFAAKALENSLFGWWVRLQRARRYSGRHQQVPLVVAMLHRQAAKPGT